MKGSLPFLFILLFVICSAEEDTVKQNEDTLKEYENELQSTAAIKRARKPLPCPENLMDEIAEVVKEGEKSKFQKKSNKAKLYVVISGFKSSYKTLFTNVAGFMNLRDIPEMDFYPRSVIERQDNSYIYEHINLNEGSVANQAAAAYFITDAIKDGKGVKLWFPWVPEDLAETFEYFKAIADHNPNIGFYNFSNSESFAAVNTTADHTSPKFGKHPAFLWSWPEIVAKLRDNGREIWVATKSSEYIRHPIIFPIYPLYKECVESKMNKKILSDLRNYTTGLLKYFEGIKNDKKKSQADKNKAFDEAFDAITNILNAVSPNMTYDTVTKPLAEYMTKLNLKPDAEKVRSIDNYAKVIISIQPTYEVPAWSQGLDPLLDLLSETKINQEFGKAFDTLKFDCINQKHQMIAPTVLYELEFEKARRPLVNADSIIRIMNDTNQISSEDFVELYKGKANDTKTSKAILNEIQKKLKSFNTTECKFKNFTGKCDEKKGKKLANLIRQGANVTEVEANDLVVLILGTEKSGKGLAAYTLAGQRFNPSLYQESEIYPQFIMHPIDSPHSIYTGPSIDKDKQYYAILASDYTTFAIMNRAVAAKLIVTLDEKTIKDASALMVIMEQTSKMLRSGGKNGFKSIGFIVSNVEVDIAKINEKAKTVSDSLMSAIEKQLRQAKSNTKTAFDYIIDHKKDLVNSVGIMPAIGKMSDDKTFEAVSKHLKKVVNENIRFLPQKEHRLEALLSTGEIKLAQCGAKYISDELIEGLTVLTEPLKQSYKNWEEERMKHYEELFEKYHDILITLPEILDSVIKAEEVNGMFQPLTDHIITMQADIDVDSIIILQSQVRFLNSTGNSVDHVLDKGFSFLRKYIKNARRWYYFISKVDEELAVYDVMKVRGKYLEPAQDLLTKISDESASLQDVDAFIDRLDVDVKDALKNLHGEFNPNPAKIHYFGLILDRLFATPLEIKCEDGMTLCGGTYVILSDCIAQKCRDSKHIEVQASSRVYVDTNVNEPGGFFSIIAPEWYIIKNRTFLLSGEDNLVKPAAARDGSGTGAPGAKGKPGAPGKQGGTFLGVGEKFTYLDGSLSVSADGGRGGPGQDGGEGDVGQEPGRPSEQVDRTSRKDYKTEGYGMSITYYVRKSVSEIILTKDGPLGGRGGDGGIGGFGGLSGTATIVSVNGQETGIKATAEPGKMGINGTGGLTGKYIFGKWLLDETNNYDTYTYKITNTTLVRFYNKSEHGTDGGNSEGRKNAKPMELITNTAKTINRFKFFFREITNRRARFTHHREFLRKITDCPDLIQLYDTVAIADDFQRLESHAYKLKQKTSIVPYYEMLGDELNSFTNIAQINEEENRVLAFVYTATLSKLAGERTKETFLVIDLPGYLSTIKDEIILLQNLETDQIAQSYKDDYVENVEKKIAEAENLIENEVKPVVSKFEEELSDQIPKIIAAVVDMKKANRENKEKLIEKQKELQKSCLFRKIMAGLNCVVSLTSFLGPTAAAIGGALTAGARIVDATVLSKSPEDAVAKLAGIPASVNGQLVTVLALLESKKGAFTDQLSDISGRLDKMGNGKDVKTINDKVSYTKKELAKIDPKKLDPKAPKQMSDLRTGLSKTMQASKNAVASSLANDEKIDKRMENIGRLQTVLTMGDQMARDYQSIKSGDDELDQVGEAIQQADKDLEKLNAYEISVYTDMLPLVNQVIDSTSGFSDANKGKSHAALDVSQWKTAEYLSDMKETLSKMTEGFSASEDIKKVITKVQSGITVMTQVFQRIQDEQDKADLAIFLGDINSNKASAVHVKNPVLNKIINDIQIAIQRNIIMQKFDLCYKSFLQTLFPFGTEVFQEYNLPAKIANTNDTVSLITYATQRVTDMINHIRSSQTTISTHDADIFNNQYFDHGCLNPPFYEWSYEDNKEAITNLLEGKSAELDADITRLSSHVVKKIAVKFNIMRLAFYPRDAKLTPALKKVLDCALFSLVPLDSFYYKCDSKFYSMDSVPFEILYSHEYEDNSKILPRSANDVFRKIQKNTPMFSPYTRWNVTIYPAMKKHLKDLKQFIGKPIDVKLIGQGFYVDEDSVACSENLDRVYKREKSLISILPDPEEDDDEWEDD